MNDGQLSTHPESDPAPFKVHLLTRAGRVMRARGEPVRAFSTKGEAVRFAVARRRLGRQEQAVPRRYLVTRNAGLGHRRQFRRHRISFGAGHRKSTQLARPHVFEQRAAAEITVHEAGDEVFEGVRATIARLPFQPERCASRPNVSPTSDSFSGRRRPSEIWRCLLEDDPRRPGCATNPCSPRPTDSRLFVQKIVASINWRRGAGNGQLFFDHTRCKRSSPHPLPCGAPIPIADFFECARTAAMSLCSATGQHVLAVALANTLGQTRYLERIGGSKGQAACA
jgi:hypothetical protein